MYVLTLSLTTVVSELGGLSKGAVGEGGVRGTKVMTGAK